MKEKEIIHPGKVEGGKLYLQNLTRYHDSIRYLDGQDVELVIRKRRYKASPEAHRYYRGVLVKKYAMKVKKWEGWTAKEIDEYFHDQYLTDEIKIPVSNQRSIEEQLTAIMHSGRKVTKAKLTDNGKMFLVRTQQSTSNLDSNEYREFTEQVRREIQEQGVEIHDIEEYTG